jgi:hypothetical protein
MQMNLLEPPDSTHLQAAQGWLDLGNHIEANEELEEIGGFVKSDAGGRMGVGRDFGVESVIEFR